jgi:hypothetical protein
MRIYLTNYLNYFLNIPLYNYWQLLTSTEIYSSCDHLSAHITHLLTLFIDSQFRLLSEIFSFFRKHSSAFGNIRLLSETFGCFRKHSTSFGNIRLFSEIFGCFRKHSAAFGNIRVSGISVGVACNAVIYLPSLKSLQPSKMCQKSSEFLIFL